jgi:translation initiation factor 1
VAPDLPRDGYLRVGRSSKGHAGKTVTTITGAPGSLDELRALVQTLKKQCGSGGTVQPDGVLVLQGDMRERVERRLTELGYKVKRVGG